MSYGAGYAHWIEGDNYLPALVQPPVEAWRAAPLTLEELDKHPDAARIWATVMVVRASLASPEDMQNLVDQHARVVKDMNDDMESLQKELDGMVKELKEAGETDQIRAELKAVKDEVTYLLGQVTEARAAESAMYETVRIVTMTRKRQRALGRVPV